MTHSIILLLLEPIETTFGSLRNKRPDLSGRPPCKGVAIGVARRGARLGGERTLRVPPCCSFPVSHSGGPHVVSFVTGRRSCARGARVRAGVARRAAESVRASWRGKACRKKEEEKKCRPKRDKGQRSKTRKKVACVPQGWEVLWRQRRCACAVILATPVLCKEQEELHSCVEEAVAGVCACAVLCWQ